MALSYYSETLDHPNPDMGLHDYPSEIADALIGFCDPIDIPIDYLFDSPPDNLFNCNETESSLLHSFSDPSILSLPSDLYPSADVFDLCQCPKRPRSCGDLYQPPDLMFEANSCNRPFVGPEAGIWQTLEFAIPPQIVECSREKKTGNDGCLSAQSVAARQRRKRISEKTQELGRLIPGGNKMNTAEMFHAAFKYVKFLQAQIGILQLMGSVQESKRSPEAGEQLQVLLTSPVIHEKLSGEGSCLIPKGAVHALAEDSEIKSSPSILRDLDRIIKSIGK